MQPGSNIHCCRLSWIPLGGRQGEGVDPFRHFPYGNNGFLGEGFFGCSLRSPRSEKPTGRSHCRVNSRASPQSAGIPIVSDSKLLSPEDQGLRGLGFMGLRFLGLEFRVSGLLDVPGFRCLRFRFVCLGILDLGLLGLSFLASGLRCLGFLGEGFRGCEVSAFSGLGFLGFWAQGCSGLEQFLDQSVSSPC